MSVMIKGRESGDSAAKFTFANLREHVVDFIAAEKKRPVLAQHRYTPGRLWSKEGEIR